jgi:hypothetical protein
MMKIFKQEIRDGLQDIANDTSFTFTSRAMSLDGADSFKPNLDLSNLSIASDLSSPEGLFPLKSILVSVGKNLNDEIFTRENLWASRNTPTNKPFNLMHNQNEIIGHITDRYVVDENYKVWASEEMPDGDFHIVSTALIYKDWIDRAKSAKIANIIKEIETTEKWYVSMECSLGSFDYGLQTSTGELIVIERNEATAYLSKYLKKYGGVGVYEDYTVGRVLNDIRFIGKGLVDRPANPKSIIIKSENFSQAETEHEQMTQEQKDALTKELETAKAEILELTKKINEETSKAKLEAFESQIQEKTTKIAELESSVASAKDELAKVSAELEVAKAELTKSVTLNQELCVRVNEFEKEKTLAKRSALLSEIGVEDVESTVASLAILDDSAFEKFVDVMKATKIKTSTAAATVETPAEKPEDVLDNAEETATASLSDIDGAPTDISTAAASYFASILKTPKTTKNKK